MVIVPADEPLLAGMVTARSTGGLGGPGGAGGDGGAGGRGGVPQGSPGQQCQSGSGGAQGPKGQAGPDGPASGPGLHTEILPVPKGEVFGARVSEGIADLISYSDGQSR